MYTPAIAIKSNTHTMQPISKGGRFLHFMQHNCNDILKKYN